MIDRAFHNTILALAAESAARSADLDEVTVADLDSISVVELMAAVEEAVGRTVADGTFMATSTLGDVARFVEEVAPAPSS